MTTLTLVSVPSSKMGSSTSDHVKAHQTVMGLFTHAGDEPRSDANILFRQEPRRGRFLIQATSRVDDEQLDALGGAQRQTTLNVWPAGTRFTYRINAAATIRLSRQNRTRPLAADEVGDWWGLCAGRHGFALLDEPGTHLMHLFESTTRARRRNAPPVIRIAVLEGVGEVVDPDKVAAARRAGIGRAKAYGCGLFSAQRG